MSETPIKSTADPATDDDPTLDLRVIVLAPFGRDAADVCRVLSDAGLDAARCTDVDAVCREIRRGAAAALLSEEALDHEGRARLSATLDEEPKWSDFPVLIMTSRSREKGDEWQVLRGISGTAYLSLLERPLHVSTLVSAVRTATRARVRQYQVRDALAARKRAEDELRTLNRNLEARVRDRTADLDVRNQELQNFVHAASHDLREPLRKIQTFASLLQDEAGEKLGENDRHYLERMVAAAARMEGQLHDLLDFSRVTSHAAPATPVHLGTVVADVLKDYECTIQDSRGEVDVEADVTIHADGPQLRQLMSHLIGNALKFRRPDEAPRLHIRAVVVDEDEAPLADASGPVCRITVEDEGLGFEPRFARRIFEPFERLHSPGAYEGRGMGLAVCQRIVQRHRGSITAESTPGEGSRFVVLLPVHRKTHGDDEGLPAF